MLREVEAGGFLLRRDAQADDLVDDKEQHQRAHDGDAPGNAHAGELVEQLAPVAVDGAGGQRRLPKIGVDGAGGEEAGEQRAEGSAGSVNAKGVERVVVAEAALDHEDHEGAEEAGDQADEPGPRRAGQSRRRG